MFKLSVKLFLVVSFVMIFNMKAMEEEDPAIIEFYEYLSKLISHEDKYRKDGRVGIYITYKDFIETTIENIRRDKNYIDKVLSVDETAFPFEEIFTKIMNENEINGCRDLTKHFATEYSADPEITLLSKKNFEAIQKFYAKLDKANAERQRNSEYKKNQAALNAKMQAYIKHNYR